MKKVSVFFGSDFLVAISVFLMVVIAIGGFISSLI